MSGDALIRLSLAGSRLFHRTPFKVRQSAYISSKRERERAHTLLSRYQRSCIALSPSRTRIGAITAPAADSPVNMDRSDGSLSPFNLVTRALLVITKRIDEPDPGLSLRFFFAGSPMLGTAACAHGLSFNFDDDYIQRPFLCLYIDEYGVIMRRRIITRIPVPSAPLCRPFR